MTARTAQRAVPTTTNWEAENSLVRLPTASLLSGHPKKRRHCCLGLLRSEPL